MAILMYHINKVTIMKCECLFVLILAAILTVGCNKQNFTEKGDVDHEDLPLKESPSPEFSIVTEQAGNLQFENILSTFYLRLNSFSLWVDVALDNDSYLRFLVSGELPFERGRKYMVPTEENSEVWESSAMYLYKPLCDDAFSAIDGYVILDRVVLSPDEQTCLVEGKYNFTMDSLEGDCSAFLIEGMFKNVTVTYMNLRSYYD